jgi:hypothetical protein
MKMNLLTCNRREGDMNKKIICGVICAIMIVTTFVVATPSNKISNTETSSIINYQIGFKTLNGSETWSDWASDGNETNATFYSFSFLADLLIRIEAPGYHVEYQIGVKNRNENISWSAWVKDGDIANATFNFIRLPVTLYMRIMVPGYLVQYQIGFKNWDNDINWSSWEYDGDIANTTFNYIQLPSSFCMRAVLIVPISASIDIDPNTLNLKSKGKWITCYITLPDGYDVNHIDISTILLEDIIPAEWGDVQGNTLMVKFDRATVKDYIGVPHESIELWVSGEFFDGTKFEGSDTIRVICPP